MGEIMKRLFRRAATSLLLVCAMGASSVMAQTNSGQPVYMFDSFGGGFVEPIRCVEIGPPGGPDANKAEIRRRIAKGMIGLYNSCPDLHGQTMIHYTGTPQKKPALTGAESLGVDPNRRAKVGRAMDRAVVPAVF